MGLNLDVMALIGIQWDVVRCILCFKRTNCWIQSDELSVDKPANRTRGTTCPLTWMCIAVYGALANNIYEKLSWLSNVIDLCLRS